MSANVTARQKYLLNKMNSIASDAQLGTLIETLDTAQAVTSAEVTGALITGYVAGTEGSVTAVSASDTVLQALQKLDGNKPSNVSTSVALTVDHSVGSKTVRIEKIGNHCTIHSPACAISDGLGTVAAYTAVAAAYRPVAAVTFSIMVIDNGTTRKAGQVVMSSAGVMTVSVLGAAFTNAAAAGWDAFSITYSLA